MTLDAGDDSVKIASLTGGSVSANLGDGNDSIEIGGIAADTKVTLTGGSGNDTYNLKNISGNVTITDFGFASGFDGGEKDGNLGIDTIYVANLEESNLSNITYSKDEHKVTIDSNITLTVTGNDEADEVYAMIGKSGETAQTYKITSGGASLEDTEDTPQEDNDNILNDWTGTINKDKGKEINQPDGSEYYLFTGIDNLNLAGGNTPSGVKIGIYQTSDKVYAFASTATTEVPSKIKISESGEEVAEDNATLVASGSGTINGNKIDSISLTLQNGADLKTLGFSGSDITSITNADSEKTIYSSGNLTVGSITSAGDKTLTLKAGSDPLNVEVTTSTSGKIDVVGGEGNDSLNIAKVEGDLTATLGAGADNVEIAELASNKKLEIKDVGTGDDKITVNKVSGTGTFTISDSGSNTINATVESDGKVELNGDIGTLEGQSGTSFDSVTVQKTENHLAVSAATDKAIELESAVIGGQVSIAGSDKNDNFDIAGVSDSNNNGLTLTGGKGNDTYKLNGNINATIIGFGFVSADSQPGELGKDIIYVNDIASKLSDKSIKIVDNKVTIGKVALSVASGTTVVYANIASGTGDDSIKIYKIGTDGASVLGDTPEDTSQGGGTTPSGDDTQAGATLLGDWTSLDTAKGAKLTDSEGELTYSLFNGMTLKNVSGITKDVTIGIYKTNDGVYAFASTFANNNTDDSASLIASGTGKLSGGKVSDITLTLQSGAESTTLGFTGENVSGITNSAKANTIYSSGSLSVNNIVSKDSILTLKPGSDSLSVMAKSSSGKVDIVGGDKVDSVEITKVEGTLNATLGSGDDSVEIAELASGANLTIKDVDVDKDNIDLTKVLGTATFIAAGSGDSSIDAAVGSGGQAVLQVTGAGTLTGGSGTSLIDTSIKKSDSLLIVSASGKTSINGASVNGKVSVVGSTGADYFNIAYCPTANDKITLTGGSGKDGYYFGSAVNATVTDFGFVNSLGSAKTAASGADIIYLSSVADTIGTVKYSSGILKIGDSVVLQGANKTDTTVYALIAASGKDAKTYSINASGASLVGASSSSGTDTPKGGTDTVTVSGGTVTYESVKGSSGTDGTTFTLTGKTGASYVDLSAATGNSIIKGIKTYNGSNDSTATVINTSGAVESITSSIDSSGNLVLKDGSKTITIEDFEAGSAIKLGTAKKQEVAVIGGTGNTAVASGLGSADYYLGASGGNTTFDFRNTSKTYIDLSGNSALDGATYKYVKGITGSSDGESWLVSGTDAITLQAAGKGDTLVGASEGADTLISASNKTTNFLLQSGNGADVVQDFVFGTGVTSDQILVDTTISYDETIVSASNGKVRIGEGTSALILSASGKDTVAMQYNHGKKNPGIAFIDTSEDGVSMKFNNNYNIMVGQGSVTTVVAGSGDTVKAKDSTMPSGIGWNSDYLISNVGLLDASASNMTAANGAKHSSDVVKAATGSNLELIWVCGGIGANFSDKGDDTLVASGKGHDEIFVGAKMGDDVIQNAASNDKITFIDTKVSNYGGDINKIITIDDKTNTFSAVFTANGSTTTIKATTYQTLSNTKNLTFHFDDVDYVWDGSKLNKA